MKTIYKYTIDLEENRNPAFIMPGVGRFLYLREREVQGVPSRRPRIDTWWLVDDQAPKIELKIYSVFTGDPVPAHTEYLGTAIPGHELVVHVFREDHRFEDLEIVDGIFVKKPSQ